MFPDLFSATTEYWRQLDEIEYRYKQGELSIEEVDKEVEIYENSPPDSDPSDLDENNHVKENLSTERTNIEKTSPEKHNITDSSPFIPIKTAQPTNIDNTNLSSSSSLNNFSSTIALFIILFHFL